VIRYAKRVEWATYNEKPRRSEDPNYRSNEGSALMAPGHVVAVGAAVPIRKAFRWLDTRHSDGLQPGSILDPLGDEPFHWQLAMVIRTTNIRREAARPFTAIRRSDLMVPSSSSRPERALRDNLARAGVAVCKHLRTLRISEKSLAPDIAIPELRTIIEYDGAYWHHGQVNHERDIVKSSRLIDAGWKVIRVREAGLEPLEFSRRGFRQFSIPTIGTSQELVGKLLSLIK
jgi:G:T-mismatch repair DNA endonuclease (very short patch repair protein)